LPALNGHELLATEVECVHIMLAVAAGELDETALATWLRNNTRSMN
jgi:death on curing protein